MGDHGVAILSVGRSGVPAAAQAGTSGAQPVRLAEQNASPESRIKR
jgi:hypothetical protein